MTQNTVNMIIPHEQKKDYDMLRLNAVKRIDTVCSR